jgi:hypothetical protein
MTLATAAIRRAGSGHRIAAGAISYRSHMLALGNTESELAAPVPSARVQHCAYARSQATERLVR